MENACDRRTTAVASPFFAANMPGWWTPPVFDRARASSLTRTSVRQTLDRGSAMARCCVPNDHFQSKRGTIEIGSLCGGRFFITGLTWINRIFFLFTRIDTFSNGISQYFIKSRDACPGKRRSSDLFQ